MCVQNVTHLAFYPIYQQPKYLLSGIFGLSIIKSVVSLHPSWQAIKNERKALRGC